MWNIRVPQRHVIELRFLTFTLNAANVHTWLKVRDGDSHTASLLLYTSGDVTPGVVRSSRHVIRIEFMSPYRGASLDYDVSKEGFSLVYTAQGN